MYCTLDQAVMAQEAMWMNIVLNDKWIEAHVYRIIEGRLQYSIRWKNAYTMDLNWKWSPFIRKWFSAQEQLPDIAIHMVGVDNCLHTEAFPFQLYMSSEHSLLSVLEWHLDITPNTITVSKEKVQCCPLAKIFFFFLQKIGNRPICKTCTAQKFWSTC